MQGIYGIHNVVSDKWYVGQSVDIKRRWVTHRSSLCIGKHDNTHLQLSYHKYGVGTFEFAVLEEVSDFISLTEREEFWIRHKRETSGGVYNQRVVADSNKGYKRSSEAIEKTASFNRGKTPSVETRKKMSLSQTGRKHTPETRKKMSISGKGRKHSPATIAKISASKKGHVASSATRKKMSSSGKGRKKSPETCAKLSEVRRGKQMPPATRAKLSAAKRKFSVTEVLEIRNLKKDGMPSVALAIKFGCAVSTINNVISYYGVYTDSK